MKSPAPVPGGVFGNRTGGGRASANGPDVARFDRFARPYDLLMPRARADALHGALARARGPVRRGLDVAGGTGRGARSVPGVEWTVVDAAPGMAATARRRGVPALVGDAARLPVRDGAVDAVLVVDALHHVADQRGLLAEAARVLRPGGVLVVREFDPATVRGRALVAAERLVGFRSTFHTPDGLSAMARAAGLDPVLTERGVGYTLAARRPADRSGADLPPD